MRAFGVLFCSGWWLIQTGQSIPLPSFKKSVSKFRAYEANQSANPSGFEFCSTLCNLPGRLHAPHRSPIFSLTCRPKFRPKFRPKCESCIVPTPSHPSDRTLIHEWSHGWRRDRNDRQQKLIRRATDRSPTVGDRLSWH